MACMNIPQDFMKRVLSEGAGIGSLIVRITEECRYYDQLIFVADTAMYPIVKYWAYLKLVLCSQRTLDDGDHE